MTPGFLPIHCDVKLYLQNGTRIFGPGPYALLRLVGESGSVRTASEAMGISYSKAWKMVTGVERDLGCPVVERKRGGAAGGSTSLTAEGRRLLDCYERFARRADEAAGEIFGPFFEDLGK